MIGLVTSLRLGDSALSILMTVDLFLIDYVGKWEISSHCLFVLNVKFLEIAHHPDNPFQYPGLTILKDSLYLLWLLLCFGSSEQRVR